MSCFKLLSKLIPFIIIISQKTQLSNAQNYIFLNSEAICNSIRAPPCKNEGICSVSSNGTYLCKCHRGFYGRYCENKYSDDYHNEEFDFDEHDLNFFIPVAIITSLILFSVLLPIAVLTDRLNNKRPKLIVMSDPIKINMETFYLLTIETGSGISSGTKAKIYCEIFGTNGRTKALLVNNNHMDVMVPNYAADYLISTPLPLGHLIKIRLCIETEERTKSGEIVLKSWYCRKVVLRDVKEEKSWFFFVNDWLSTVETSWGGRVLKNSIEVGAATHDEVREHYSNRFTWKDFWHQIREHHMWICAFTSPPRSFYTRAERVTSAAALFFSYMLINLFFYGVTSNDQHEANEKYTTVNFRLYYPIFSKGTKSSLVGIICGYLFSALFRYIDRRRIPALIVWNDAQEVIENNDSTSEVDLKNLDEENKNLKPNKDDSSGANDYVIDESKWEDLDLSTTSQPKQRSQNRQRNKFNQDQNYNQKYRTNNLNKYRTLNNLAAIGQGDFDLKYKNSQKLTIKTSPDYCQMSEEVYPNPTFAIRPVLNESKLEAVSKELEKLVALNGEILESAQSLEASESLIGDDFEDDFNEEIIKYPRVKLCSIRSFEIKNKLLPPCFLYIAWTISLLTIASSSVILIYFGIRFNRIKAHDWIYSFIWTFLESIFIIQPLKVFVFYILFICRRRVKRHRKNSHWLDIKLRFKLLRMTEGEEFKFLPLNYIIHPLRVNNECDIESENCSCLQDLRNEGDSRLNFYEASEDAV